MFGSPRVSVLVPAYNQAHFLGRAIESVLDQAFPDFEIIVLDDGSTDETASLARSLGDQIVYVRQENAGPSAARNAALSVARGELIQLLDADDELTPGYLERMIEAVERRPQAAVFTASWDEIDTTGSVTGHVDAKPWPADTFHALFDPMCLGPPCRYLLRREALEEAGCFDTAMPACEDWDLWVRMAARGARFHAVPDARARYRAYPTSLSKNYLLMWASGQRVLERAARLHGNCPVCRRARRRGLVGWRAWCYISMLAPSLRLQLDRHDYRGAARRAAGAVVADPRLVPILVRSARTRSYPLARAGRR